MFNNYLFNTSVFNEVSLEDITAPQDDIVYNGFGLQNLNIIVSRIDFDNGHSVSSETYNAPMNDLGGELNFYFRSKVVTLDGVMKFDTCDELNDNIDKLKKVLGQNNKDLDIKVNGTIRRAKATCVNIDNLFKREHFNLTFIPFQIKFRMISEFSRELTRQSQSLTGQTAGFTEEITNNGSVRVNPTINALFNSATSVTSFALNIGSDTITITNTFSASDVLVIDCEDKTVKLNGIAIDYSGVFPILEVGVNSYTITINGTKNFDITLSYFNNFL